MREFTTATGAIAYELLGPETPRATVLLLHNILSTGRTAWGMIALRLADEGYRVILPDLPGHGHSRGFPPGLVHREMAAQLADLARGVMGNAAGDAAGDAPLHVAGCSAGGILAQWIVHDHLLPAQTLTVVSSTFSVNSATTGVVVDLRPEAFKFGSSWLEATAKLHDPIQGAGYFETTLLPLFRSLRPADMIDLHPAALADWQLPVCIIHGAEDEIFPDLLAGEMHMFLPNSELHMIPGQGHALIFRQSRQVSALLLQFLARHTPPQPNARASE